MTSTDPQSVPDGYAQYQYLDRKETVSFAPGIGGAMNIVASITVPVGQYWLPKVMRVSLKTPTGTKFHSQLYSGPPPCQIYYGAPQQSGVYAINNAQINDNLGLYLDGTLRGDADQSGVCAGMFLTPGTSLTAIWHGATAPTDGSGNYTIGGTAVFEIIGLSSNVPLSSSLAALPGTMGESFRGKPVEGRSAFATGGGGFVVSNPGAGNIVVIMDNLPPYMEMQYMQWQWSSPEPTSGQYSGVFYIRQTTPVPYNGVVIAYDTASVYPKHVDFKGMSSQTPGGRTQLVFQQQSGSGMISGFVLTGTFLYTPSDTDLSP